ncbi:hypothetical protein HK102_009508, partial [Quaeritorhiza haematococci]
MHTPLKLLILALAFLLISHTAFATDPNANPAPQSQPDHQQAQASAEPPAGGAQPGPQQVQPA